MKLQGESNNMDNQITAQVRFCHDMEGGWYRLDYDGYVVELNNWCDMREFIKENNLDAKWVGDVYYKPDGIEVAA